MASVKRRVTCDSKTTPELPFRQKLKPADVQLLLAFLETPAWSALSRVM